MTKRTHPAESARKLVGVLSGVALVGIVTGFQVSANAQESQQAQLNVSSTPSVVSPEKISPETPATEAVPEAVPAPAAPQQQQVVVPDVPAPAAPLEAPAPAPVEAPAAVAPAPAAPVNGTTAGSGG